MLSIFFGKAFIGLICTTRVECIILITCILATITSIVSTLGGIIFTITVTSSVSNPFSIFNLTRLCIYNDGTTSWIQAKESKGAIIGAFLGMTSVRRVFVARIMAAIAQVKATGFGVVRFPRVACSITEVVGFFNTASWETFHLLQPVGTATYGRERLSTRRSLGCLCCRSCTGSLCFRSFCCRS